MFKVILNTRRHGISKSNPVFGSEYQCEGIIDSYYTSGSGRNIGCPTLKEFIDLNTEGTIKELNIQWDNGTNNSYRIDDLTISTTDESVTGICNTIW